MFFIEFFLIVFIILFTWHIAIPWCIYMDKVLDSGSYSDKRMKNAILEYNLDKPAYYHSIPYVSLFVFLICAGIGGPFAAMIAAIITIVWMLVIGIVIVCSFVNLIRFAMYKRLGVHITPRFILEKYRNRKGK